MDAISIILLTALTFVVFIVPIIFIAIWKWDSICYFFHTLNDGYVYERSMAIKQLEKINERYQSVFYELEREIEYAKPYKSASALEKAGAYDLLLEFTPEEVKKLKNMAKKAALNRIANAGYQMSCEEAYQNNRIHWNRKRLGRREYEIFQLIKFEPVCDVKIHIKNYYVNSRGVEVCTKNAYFSPDELEYIIYNVKQQKKSTDDFERSKQQERSAMTPSLRYKVLKRDGFRCVICGATARDGVKLHVDHIRPIAKGGKTVMENLRTLCETCNRGKSDKYDPNGVN